MYTDVHLDVSWKRISFELKNLTFNLNLMYHIAQNVGGQKLWRIHQSTHFGRKPLVDDDNKSFLLVCT